MGDSMTENGQLSNNNDFTKYLQNLFPSLVPEKLFNGGAFLIFWDWFLIASTPLIFTIFSLVTVRTSVLILLRRN